MRSIEEHEPFDSKLFAKATALATQEEELIEEIARMRREVPGKIVEQRRNTYREVENADEEILRVVDEVAISDAEKGPGVEIGKLERQDRVEGAWNGGIEGLERMVDGLPGSVAKMERAEKAEAYVLGREKK